MNPSIRVILAIFLSVAAIPAQPQATPPGSDRVFLRDLEGIWISEQYAKQLAQTRSPHATARKTLPLVIRIKREGRSYPIVVTDFNKAALQAVLDVEPNGKPGAYRLVIGADDKPVSSSEVTYLKFEGSKNAQGRFDRLRMAEPSFMKGRWADYVLVPGELSAALNRAVIAGRYTDDKGRDWEFGENGQARWPDTSFAYDLSINDPAAGCEYLQTEDVQEGKDGKRYGYAWKSGKLTIFPARLAGKKVVCGTEPLAVLTPR